MVLGISLRRRKPKEVAIIRPSPSLPNIAATGLSPSDWPEELVDINTIKKEVVTASEEGHAEDPHGTVQKSSFHSPSRVVPSFHRPFRPSAGLDGQNGAAPDPPHGRKSIASMYSANPPPSAFGNHTPATHKAPSIRRIVRVPPKFNIMVAGGQGTGKTSFLKLLLNTCDISPTANESDILAVKNFCEGPTKHTKALRTVSVEVCEERHERIHLTAIDNAGFNFEEGKELDLDRSVSTMVKYLDTQFAESMGEESKVVRQNKGDKHVHLCIYLIDPDTIMRPAARRAQTFLSFPAKPQAALRRRASLSSITSGTSDSSSDDDLDTETAEGDEEASPKRSERIPRPSTEETMAPAELQVLKRLSARCNVLPVIARADTLSDERLALVRRVVRRDLMYAGLGFGVFEPSPPPVEPRTPLKSPHRRAEVTTPQTPDMPSPSSYANEEEESEDEGRISRPVVKLRSPRTPVVRERSRSRRRLLGLEDDDGFLPQSPSGNTTVGEDPAASWPKLSRADVASMLPFAIISPEEPPKSKTAGGRRRAKSSADVNGGVSPVSNGTSPVTDPVTPPVGTEGPNTAATLRRRPSFKDPKEHIRGPAELRGQFVRKYRWGTIDVLDPAHCDFVAMRTAVLGTHMRMLKNNTKEVLYENFRTEKLLARRATRNITDADRKKLMHELGV